jgi:hypothetical protein
MDARYGQATCVAMGLRFHTKRLWQNLPKQNIRPGGAEKSIEGRRAKGLLLTIHWAAKGVQPLPPGRFLLHRRSAYLNQETDVIS